MSPRDASAADFKIRYNDIQGGWDGEGNIDQGPRLCQSGRRRFPSEIAGGPVGPGRQMWVVDKVTSPCIDAGDPTSAIGRGAAAERPADQHGR